MSNHERPPLWRAIDKAMNNTEPIPAPRPTIPRPPGERTTHRPHILAWLKHWAKYAHGCGEIEVASEIHSIIERFQ